VISVNVFEKSKPWLIVFVLGFVGAIIGFSTGFPLGVVLGSVFLISIWKLTKNDLPKLPIQAKRIIQVIVGGSIGLAFTNQTFSILKSIWLPAILISLINILLALALAFTFHRLLKFDILTSLASSAPAGMSEMVLLAEKYDTNVSTVVSIHLFRVIVIITTIPFIVNYLVN
jgi:uncharacterized protein